MLYANINHLGAQVPYIHASFQQWIKEAVQIASAAEPGKYQLAQQDVFVVVAEATTEPQQQRQAEIHKNYIDVQILLSGKERLGYGLYPPTEYAELDALENDVVLFDSVSDEQFIDLNAGDFVIFYPNEPHRPLCASDEICAVKKAIVKIPRALCK
ncbi:hypothetical protein GCM10011369_29540 [Neiella marina]|uniref:DUF386 domain-containing protein n=1 Tax=Neiella marina TaxID=508461 RepID=A0A8J2XQM1_9GAMM|nr:YhcH/YjgK/YiaL family protein [Neiella marina]GGA85588.1 hypothetical protein GCM10011369_29540 [Neiella marina]